MGAGGQSHTFFISLGTARQLATRQGSISSKDDSDKFRFRSSSVAYGDDSIIPRGRERGWRDLHRRQRLNRSRTLMTCLYKCQLTASSAKGRVVTSVRFQQLSLALRRMWPSTTACARVRAPQAKKRAISTPRISPGS
jgi:hypothetical protein